MSFAVADVEKTAGAFADVFGVEMSDAQKNSEPFHRVPAAPC